MWPSPETAARLFNYSNVALLVGLAVGLIATLGIFWFGAVKERHWETKLANTEHRADSVTTELERLKAPRVLSAERMAMLTAQMSAFRGQVVSVGAIPETAEGAALERQIYSALKAAGMTAEVNRGAAGVQVGSIRGVLIAVVKGNVKAERFASALAQFLTESGIPATWQGGLRESLARESEKSSQTGVSNPAMNGF
jgi:hypothetical protein